MCLPPYCSNGPFILGPCSVCLPLGSYEACEPTYHISWSLSPGATIGRWGWGGGWTTRAWSLTCNRLTGYWWHIFQKENPVKYAKNWSNKYRLVITIIEVAIVPLVSRLLPPLSPLPPREVFLFSLPSFPNFNSHYHIKMADCGGFGSIDFLVKATGLSDPGLRLVIGLFSGTLFLCYNLVIFDWS